MLTKQLEEKLFDAVSQIGGVSLLDGAIGVVSHFSRRHCHITRNGVSMLRISEAVEYLGFRTMG